MTVGTDFLAVAAATHFQWLLENLGGRTAAPLTLLPQDAGNLSPACLDGSPYGLYFMPSVHNSTKWTISMQGGGWCYNEADCLGRSQTDLGSSRLFGKQSGCVCMNPDEKGNLDNDCNCIFLPYCDGASFSGYRPDPWPIPNKPGKSIHFRGIKNLDVAIEFALAHGMDKATEFVLTGRSAGGLATFLHADRVAERVRARAPDCKIIRAVPEVGFFLDHPDMKHDTHSFTDNMKYVYSMQNLTFGADGGLESACQALFPDSPHLCFMSPHMQQVVQTPFFILNSRFDAWHLDNILMPTGPGPGFFVHQAILDFGHDFLVEFAPVEKEPRHGAFITTCIGHMFIPWKYLELDGKRAYEHLADWYWGKTTGAAAIAIDTRGPSGDGTLPRECHEATRGSHLKL